MLYLTVYDALQVLSKDVPTEVPDRTTLYADLTWGQSWTRPITRQESDRLTEILANRDREAQMSLWES